MVLSLLSSPGLTDGRTDMRFLRHSMMQCFQLHNRSPWRHKWLGSASHAQQYSTSPSPQSAPVGIGPAADWKALLQRTYSQLTVPPPPPPSQDLPAWVDQPEPQGEVEYTRRVFCNRSLNMASIEAVGFDMDYTLAQYRPETFETLAYTLTIDKLVNNCGYPEELKDFKFDWRYMMRGLTIDKKRGNILKIDRHKYVKLAYHGFKKLNRTERLAVYNTERFEFDEPDFALIDTLFSLGESHIFMQLVEMHDATPAKLPAGKSYADMYRDVRAAVDLCHRDGSLKNAVAANPGKYIHEDLRLAAVLETFRLSGRKIFLATNSLYDYTHVVMNYLLGGRTGQHRTEDWMRYFDVVITGCGKPDFFTKKNSLLEVDTATGMLRNTDGGTPMVPIGEEDLPSPTASSSAPGGEDVRLPSGRARVFQGGHFKDLHKMLGISSGTEVLYVGDHIYGDILRSKKDLSWRTMLVVPELETELNILQRHASDMAELKALRTVRGGLEDQIDRLEWYLKHGAGVVNGEFSEGEDEVASNMREVIANLRQQCIEVKQKHTVLLREHHEHFHRVWGCLLKTGYQNSRYAHQIERFACLYASHVSNLSFYSPHKSWRADSDNMVHEKTPLFPSGNCFEVNDAV